MWRMIIRHRLGFLVVVLVIAVTLETLQQAGGYVLSTVSAWSMCC